MNIYIFTYKSPFSEIPEFVEEEIKYFPSTIRVTILSLANNKERKIIGLNNRPNINAFAISPNSFLNLIKIVFLSFNKRFFSELIKTVYSYPINRLFNRLYNLFVFEYVVQRYYLGYKKVQYLISSNNDNIVLYSYWLGPATIAADSIKKKYKHKFKFKIVSRAHGSDLYEYSNTSNWLPYIGLNLSICDYVFPISSHGLNYISQKQVLPSNKIILSRLGIPNHNSENKRPIKTNIFHIISCSYLIPLKRIHLIVEALSNIVDFRIKWTHIGGGPLEEELRILCSQKLSDRHNIEYTITGSISNEEVIRFYKENNINLLINVSSSEGVPVTMMEAICFGVPILSSDIGGIGEILIDEYNGILLKSTFTIIDLKNSIEQLIMHEENDYSKLCKNSINLYNSLYRAEVNYQNHVQRIIE